MRNMYGVTATVALPAPIVLIPWSARRTEWLLNNHLLSATFAASPRFRVLQCGAADNCPSYGNLGIANNVTAPQSRKRHNGICSKAG